MMCGGCGVPMGAGLNVCGSCGWHRRNQESIVDDVAQYKASEAALNNLEESGQGDSAMADAARAGMTAAKVKIIVGAIAFVVVLIIFLVILSKMHSAADNGGLGLHGVAPSAMAVWHGAGFL